MSEYWMAACPKCGWVGSSKDCEGGGQIADTGDYAEVVCPRCFKGGHGEWVEVEDAEEYLAASQAREAELQRKYETTLLMVKDLSSQCAELRKLLEESKVPEGWQLVPKTPTFDMCAVDCDFDVFIGIDTAKQVYEAMLAAAPQPKEQKQ